MVLYRIHLKAESLVINSVVASPYESMIYKPALKGRNHIDVALSGLIGRYIPDNRALPYPNDVALSGY